MKQNSLISLWYLFSKLLDFFGFPTSAVGNVIQNKETYDPQKAFKNSLNSTVSILNDSLIPNNQNIKFYSFNLLSFDKAEVIDDQNIDVDEMDDEKRILLNSENEFINYEMQEKKINEYSKINVRNLIDKVQNIGLQNLNTMVSINNSQWTITRISPALFPSTSTSFSLPQQQQRNSFMSRYFSDIRNDGPVDMFVASSMTNKAPVLQWTISNSFVTPDGSTIVGEREIRQAVKELKPNVEEFKQEISDLFNRGLLNLSNIKTLERASKMKLIDFILNQQHGD